MKAYDFRYGDKTLSSFGFVVCNFDDVGLNIVSNGSIITFNTVSTLGGSKFELVNTTYDDCLTTSFQICKHSCSKGVEEISEVELRQISRWLNRKKYLKFKPLSKEYVDIYFEASFNISRIEIDGKLYGLELEVFTNRPFALREPKIFNIKNIKYNGKYSINDVSDEEGHIYPHTEIVINENGNLDIYNAIEDRITSIKNCVAGEIITMDYPVIQSSVSSHNICDDFNWNFFRIANTYENSRNDLIISIPCTIKVKYSPIVKVGL